jgi:hypothetical protein
MAISKQEAALIEELKGVLPRSVTLEGFLRRSIKAERMVGPWFVGPRFADPRARDELEVRAIRKKGVLVLHSPSLLRALSQLAVERGRSLSDKRRKEIGEILEPIGLLKFVKPRPPGRPESGRGAARWLQLQKLQSQGMTRDKAVEQIAKEERAQGRRIEAESILQSVKRERRKR